MINLLPVKHVQSIQTQDFLRLYKYRNKPLVIEKLSQDWPAKKNWTANYFRQVAGNTMVPLYDCVSSKDRKHQHASTITMPFRDFLDRLEQGHNELRLFFYNILSGAPQLSKDFSFPDIGLHFFKKLPVLFIAAKETKIQMHFDIDYADIFLCHFGGRKRVMLFAPEQTKYLYHVPFSYSALFDVDFDVPNYEKYPALRYLQGQEVILKHGDVLYIPPGYWHYIVYEEFSISLALRAFPRTPVNFLKMLRNLLFTRSFEGLMRKIVGQPWNDWNERRAITRTHKNLR